MPMTIKITALLTSVSVAVLYLFSLKYPNDPYFYIISSSAVIAAGRLLVAAAMLYLALRKRLYFNFSHTLLYTLGALFVVAGFAGIIIAPFDYALFNYLKPLDFIFMIEAGLYFGLAATSFEHGTKPLPRLSRPRALQLRLFTGRVA